MNQVNEHELTVMVHIDGRLFRNFALFDTFRRQRKWVSPALFAAIALCFLGWTLSLDGLERSSARLASLPFFYLLACVVVGWIVARVRHGKPPKPPEAGDGEA